MIWLLAIVFMLAVLLLFYIQWKKRTIKRIGDPTLVNALIADYSPGLFLLKNTLLLLALAAGIMGMMNPRKPGSDAGGNRKGIDVVIALDISRSMLATDIQPGRLQETKKIITDLIDKMPDNRIGLVVFAGRAYIQMPLTTDHKAAKLFIETAGPEDIVQQGTALSTAVRVAASAFNKKDRKFKSVLLFSDGENHDLEMKDASEEVAAQGVMVCAVGIGTEAGSTIKEPDGSDKKDEMGNVVVSKLNEDDLKTIASATKGLYIRFTGEDDVNEKILSKLSGVEKESLTDFSLVNFKTYSGWLAGLAFLLITLEIVIP